MKTHELIRLTRLNQEETELERIQQDIDRARRKYFDVAEIQLKLDRRQAELDTKKKRVMQEKGELLNFN